ncbi:hypothetical protein [Extensimonas vulgaris]|uniref:hypothetical protein n=1 Tax=Extensimonas vulgaris TaxID=1031594 RepID=UPI0011C06D23|nr:hypothetical protein [Extensimonas vulgaris]TXD14934.1 hypothetical protein FUT63_08165 [Extensimonas vulgaris]
MGQEDGKKWAAAAHSQPTIPKSDRLLACGMDLNPDCSLGGAVHLRGRWRTSACHLSRGFVVRDSTRNSSSATKLPCQPPRHRPVS